jgi:lambda family phage tail tape measure protein
MLKDLEFRKPELSATEYEAQRAGISQGQAMLIPAADIRKASISQDQAMLNPVAKGSIEQLRKSSENMATAKANLENARLTTDQVTSRALASAEEVENLTKASTIYKQYFADQTLGLQQQDDTLQLKQAQLAQDLERGKVSQDEFNAAKYIYDTEQAGITRANALLSEQEKYVKTILDIRTKIAQAGGESPEQSQALQQAVIDTNAATAAINRQYDQTLKLRDLNKDLAERQQAYADLFTQAFRGMEDAIVEFTKTGKLSFSSMIESFIEGLLRYELQQQQMMLLKGVGGAGGLAKSLISMIPGMGGFEGSGYTAAQLATLPMAKGGAFDYGIQAFAKGGAFTNQIVDSPTLFKFARGTGLMGEAGPEAIMPLKRDSNGNLGVRGPSGGNNVEVVVNNYSTAQAETRETTDSRGNRRIEVIVGDMVAQEVAKTGSATQNAFSSTYGTRPALARR